MLRVGVLYRIGHALDYLASNPLSEKQFLTSFESWQGVSGSTVIETSKRMGWLSEKSTRELCVTPTGQAICDVQQSAARLRLQLEQVISITRPVWAALAVRGRNAVESYAPRDAVQCLSDASLLTSTDDEVVEWWDRIAMYYRSVRNEEKMVTGRLGERASFEYETKRTGTQPRWTALESNDAGYDLISRVGQADDERLLIEVKASTLDWEDAEAILTRHEWDVVSRTKHACLHLWCISRKPYQFRCVPLVAVRECVPVDRGDSHWKTLAVPFRIFGMPS